MSPERTLWISSDHRDLLPRYSGCLSSAALAEGLAGTRSWFSVDLSRAFREIPKFSVTFGLALLCSGTGAAAYLKQQVLTAPQFSFFVITCLKNGFERIQPVWYSQAGYQIFICSFSFNRCSRIKLWSLERNFCQLLTPPLVSHVVS